jgi:hypothetical protein
MRAIDISEAEAMTVSLEDLRKLQRSAYDQIEAILRRAAVEVQAISHRHYAHRAITEAAMADILLEAELVSERLTSRTEHLLTDDLTPAELFDGDYPDWLRGDR